MKQGKQTCKILKEIRKQIAAENDIKLVIEECTYQGDCLGTCPKCEAEVRYLERELEKRQRMGKAAIFAGMTIGTAITAAGCGTLVSPPNGMMENPRDTIVAADTIRNDSVEEHVLLGGEVMAPVSNSLELEEWDTEGFVEPNFDEAVEDEDRPGVYMIVEQMPEFPGGDKSLFQFIADNTKYPADAKEKGIKGRVFVNFIVEPDGSVSDIRVLRGIGGGCDEEAVRVVESMPKWKPGMQNGEVVRVSYNVPVNFRLEDKQD
jgi:TonB family protein